MLTYSCTEMSEFPETQMIFVSPLVQASSGVDQASILMLKERHTAAIAREQLARWLGLLDAPRVVVLDLDGIMFTPSALQEFILPLAQRIRGGEHGRVRLVIAASEPGVRDFVRYMAQAHGLAIYLSDSPFELGNAMPVGALTETERVTLDAIGVLGGRVTASKLAETEAIKPSAAANRLVNLDREGYLLRQPRGRREGDLYVEPRFATSAPMAAKGPYLLSNSNTGAGDLVPLATIT